MRFRKVREIDMKDTDNVRYLKFAEEKVKKNKTNLKIFVIICIVIAIVVLALFSPLFNIANIAVEGNSILEKDAIVRASGIETGVNILKINTAIAKKNVSTMAYIDEVDIKIKFPNTVLITVKESTATAYIPFIGNYIGINASGKVLEVKSELGAVECPLIYGVELERFGIGSVVEIKNEEISKLMPQFLDELSKNDLLSSVAAMDLNDENNVTLTLRNEAEVKFGDLNKLSYKIAFLKKVVSELGDARGGIIDMTDIEKVTYRAN